MKNTRGYFSKEKFYEWFDKETKFKHEHDKLNQENGWAAECDQKPVLLNGYVKGTSFESIPEWETKKKTKKEIIKEEENA